MNCSRGIVPPTRFSPIRLPVRERTYYDIETLPRSLFGNLRVDYAPQMPDLTRGDYAPCDLTAKHRNIVGHIYSTRAIAQNMISKLIHRENTLPRPENDLGTFHAGSESDLITFIFKSHLLRKLSSGNPVLAKPTGLRCSRHTAKI